MSSVIAAWSIALPESTETPHLPAVWQQVSHIPPPRGGRGSVLQPPDHGPSAGHVPPPHPPSAECGASGGQDEARHDPRYVPCPDHRLAHVCREGELVHPVRQPQR